MDAPVPPKPAKAVQQAPASPAEPRPPLFGHFTMPQASDASPAAAGVPDPFTPQPVAVSPRRGRRNAKKNGSPVSAEKFSDFRTPEQPQEGK